MAVKSDLTSDPMFAGICPNCNHVRHGKDGCMTPNSTAKGAVAKNPKKPNLKHCPCRWTPEQIAEYDETHRRA